MLDTEWALEDWKTAAPCPVSWSEMVGDEVARTCLRCDQQVYDLSNMTRDEGVATIRANQSRGENICIKYFLRRDGTIMTEECAPGLRRKLRRSLLRAVGMIASAFSLTTFVGCGPAPYEGKRKRGKTGTAAANSASKAGAGSAGLTQPSSASKSEASRQTQGKPLPRAKSAGG